METQERQHDNTPQHGNMPVMQLSDHEITLRKAWLEFDAHDAALLKEEVDEIIVAHVDEMMDMMYEHFLAFEETRTFFPSPEILTRAKSAQRQYFIELAKGSYDTEYVHNRLRIGSAHHRIELDPKWYIGAYNRAISFLIPKLIERSNKNAPKLAQIMLAFLKVMFFDMGLAIESYITAKEQAIRNHRNVIRELETEQRVTKGILENAPIGIVSMSDTFVCEECNNIFVDIVGAPRRADVVGKSLFDLFPQLDQTIFEEVLKTGHSQEKTADQLILPESSHHGGTHWDWAIWPIKDDTGKITGLVASFSDATDRVALQQQREDFVATLTHDLKTPVLATNRAVQFLLEGDFGPVSDSQKEILATVLQSNNALYKLVQALLDVYKFESGVKELSMRSCNLAALITQLVTEIMPLAQEHGIELRLVLPPEAHDVNCDDEEIRRVLQNLIDNSLKFTPFGGSITISMHQDEEGTTISVADTGKGISEENKPKLFERFWQAGSTGRYYAGTGLGLYLCRRIIEGHGGRIWCESTLGEGSTFYFQF